MIPLSTVLVTTRLPSVLVKSTVSPNEILSSAPPAALILKPPLIAAVLVAILPALVTISPAFLVTLVLVVLS